MYTHPQADLAGEHTKWMAGTQDQLWNTVDLSNYGYPITKKRIANTAKFFPSLCRIPITDPKEATRLAAYDLVDTLKNSEKLKKNQPGTITQTDTRFIIKYFSRSYFTSKGEKY